MGQAPLEGTSEAREKEQPSDNGRPRSNTAGARSIRNNEDVTTPRRGTIMGGGGKKKNKKPPGPQVVQLDLSNKNMTSHDMRAHFSASPIGRKIVSTPNLEAGSSLQGKTHNRRHSRAASTSNSTPSADALILAYLNLSNNQLTYLDGLEEIQNLSLLSELDLSFNQISNIQNSLFRGMGNLQRLNITGNKLLYVPKGMGFLVNLVDLELSRNEIAQLGNEIGQLHKLESLNVSFNQLSDLPSSLGQLRNLRKLILTNNQLMYLDIPMERMDALVWLDVSWNKLVEYPRSLNPALKKLYLGHNQIEEVLGEEVERLESLRELSLRNNKLKSLPKELANLKGTLTVLDLENNKFHEKEYEETDVELFLNWLHDPKANPITLRKKEDTPVSHRSPAASQKEWHVESYRPSLYRFKGKNRIIVHKREVNIESLNEGDTFVLDVGKQLYLWYGKQSNKRERNKGRMFAEYMAEDELGGVPVTVVKDNSPAAAEFWRTLGGDRRNIQSAEQGGSDLQFEDHFFDYVTLFKFSNVLGRIGVDEISGHESPFFRDMLNSDHSYVLNCDSTIFIWCGRNSIQKERNWALLKAEDLQEKFQPYFCEIQWAIDGAETLLFKEQFVDWGLDSFGEVNEKAMMPDEEEKEQVLRREREMERIQRERERKIAIDEQREKERIEEENIAKEKQEREQKQQHKERREREEKERQELANARRGGSVPDEDEDSDADSDEDTHLISKMTRKELAEYREKRKLDRERRQKERELKDKEDATRREREEKEKLENEKKQRNKEAREIAQREREENERKEREKEEREEREKKEKEEREKRAQEEKARKEKEDKEKRDQEQKQKKEREERERKEREKREKERQEREAQEKERKDKAEREREERERREKDEKDRKAKEEKYERERRERAEQEERERRERNAKEDEERRQEEERRELERLQRKTKMVEAEEKERKEREAREDQEKRDREERAKKAKEDLERKARQEKERKEREKKDREEKARKDREERERKAKEEKEKKERDAKERQEKEEREKKAHEEKERKEREETERKAKQERERREKEERQKREREEKEEKERKEREERERHQREEQGKKEREGKEETQPATNISSRLAPFQKTGEATEPHFHTAKTTTFHKISVSAPVVAELSTQSPQPAPAIAHPPASTGPSKFGAGAADICDTCSKRVYFSEKLVADGKTFHKTCFRCAHCNNTLKLGNYAALDGKLYCKPHFKQLFALKGNYAGGFGGKKPEELWAEKKSGGSVIVKPTEVATSTPLAGTTSVPAVGGSAIVRPVAKTMPSSTGLSSVGSAVSAARSKFGGPASASSSGGTSVPKMLAGTDAILYWAQQRTSGYRDVEITNFTTSWKDGLAFLALAHSYRPDLVDFASADSLTPGQRLEKAFSAFEAEGAIRLLDPEDITNLSVPDRLSMITYLGEVYKKTNKQK